MAVTDVMQNHTDDIGVLRHGISKVCSFKFTFDTLFFVLNMQIMSILDHENYIDEYD